MTTKQGSFANFFAPTLQMNQRPSPTANLQEKAQKSSIMTEKIVKQDKYSVCGILGLNTINDYIDQRLKPLP
jgi:hypothetical protein